jgi:branched-chain amino acid transport system substrate-binding protein
MSLMRRSFRVLAAAVAVVLAAAACTSRQPDSGSAAVGEVRIGVLAPLSKDNKAAGTDAVRGAQLAAALVNGEEGPIRLAGVGTAGLAGLGGAKVAILPADTRSDPQRGADEAVRLVDREEAVALVGAYDTEVTDVASQQAERLRVPFLNGDTSADFLTERGLDWFFRIGPNDRKFGEAFFSTLQRVPGGKTQRVAVLYANDRPSNVVKALTEELADEGGYQLLRPPGPGRPGFQFQPTTKDRPADPTKAIGQVRAQQPDAVFVVASQPRDAEQALKAFGRLNYTPPAILTFGAGFFEPTVLQTAGRDGQGLLYSTAWSREVASRNPAAKPIMDVYEARFAAPMTEVAASSFTAVLVLVKAIDDARSVDPQRVRAALLNLDIPGRDTIMPWNGVRFDATHQNTGATGVVEQAVQDNLRVIFPAELAQNEPVWPLAAARG